MMRKIKLTHANKSILLKALAPFRPRSRRQGAAPAGERAGADAAGSGARCARRQPAAQPHRPQAAG